jgi:cyanophycin synthetase
MQDAKKVFHKLLKKKKKIMVEEFVEGDVFRILVFNNEIIDAYKKEPNFIVGNGVFTLGQLIAEDQLDRTKTQKPQIQNIDWKFISSQGYTKQSKIPINTKVLLTTVANVNNGAIVTSIKIDNIHPDNVALFKKINKVCGLNLNGIDYISHDLSISHKIQGSVLENNARPGIDGHYTTNVKSMDKFFKLIKF